MSPIPTDQVWNRLTPQEQQRIVQQIVVRVQLPSRSALCGGLVEALLFLLDPVFHELIPFAVEVQGSGLEHGPGACQAPVHACAILRR